MLLLLAACSGGGGGGGSKQTNTVPLVKLSAVAALYPTNGADWNDYVQGVDIKTATDTACVAATDTACIHAGEARVVEVSGKTSCAGLTAADALSAFTGSAMIQQEWRALFHMDLIQENTYPHY